MAAQSSKTALRRSTAVTYITHTEDGRLAGFYSLRANSVNRDDVRGWLTRNSQIPIPLLGMLAIDETCQETDWAGDFCRMPCNGHYPYPCR